MVRVHEGPPYQNYQGSAQVSPHENPAVRGVLTPSTVSEAVEAFCLSRSVSGCTARTVALYREVLRPFTAAMEPDVSRCTTLTVQGYLSRLRARVSPVTAHLHYAKVRAFFAWCLETGLLSQHPLRGFTMKAPKQLPRVPALIVTDSYALLNVGRRRVPGFAATSGMGRVTRAAFPAGDR